MLQELDALSIAWNAEPCVEGVAFGVVPTLSIDLGFLTVKNAVVDVIRE